VIEKMKILTEEALNEILAESTSTSYFFQKEKGKETREGFQNFYEKDGSVIVIFKTGMAQIEPEEEDQLGRIWNPRLKDDEGNPILDRGGNPRQAWAKFEAKAEIKGTETIYGFGGKSGILLKGFVSEMKKNEIKNPELPGTKWKIKCVGGAKYNTWDIEFLGKEEVPKEKVESKKAEEPNNYDRIKDTIIGIKEDNLARTLAGLGKEELIGAVAYKSKLSEKEVEKVFPQLEENGVVKMTGDKVYIQ